MLERGSEKEQQNHLLLVVVVTIDWHHPHIHSCVFSIFLTHMCSKDDHPPLLVYRRRIHTHTFAQMDPFTSMDGSMLVCSSCQFECKSLGEIPAYTHTKERHKHTAIGAVENDSIACMGDKRQCRPVYDSEKVLFTRVGVCVSVFVCGFAGSACSSSNVHYNNIARRSSVFSFFFHHFPPATPLAASRIAHETIFRACLSHRHTTK